MLKRLGCGERVSSTVTLGKLFLICQQKAPCLFFFPSLHILCFSSTIWAPGTAEPLIYMTGIGKTGAEMQTAAGSRSSFPTPVCRILTEEDLLTLVRALSAELSPWFFFTAAVIGAVMGWRVAEWTQTEILKEMWVYEVELRRIIKSLCFYLYCFLFTEFIRVCECPDIVSLMRSSPSLSTPTNYDCRWWNDAG